MSRETNLQDGKFSKNKLRPENHNEQNNSLNYCKFKFDIDIKEIRNQRLRNRMLVNQNKIEKLQKATDQ